MKLVFQSGAEFVKLEIDRANKRFAIATSQTGYRFIRQPYHKLFGNSTAGKPPTEEESLKEMIEMERLNDQEFINKLETDMAKVGYKRIK